MKVEDIGRGERRERRLNTLTIIRIIGRFQVLYTMNLVGYLSISTWMHSLIYNSLE